MRSGRAGSASGVMPRSRSARGSWLAAGRRSNDVPRIALTCGINMGLAFGTGEHPTTALCLEWLEARTSRSGMTRARLRLRLRNSRARRARARRELAWAVDNDRKPCSDGRERRAERRRRAPVRRRAGGAAGASLSTCSPPTFSPARSSSSRRRSRSAMRARRHARAVAASSSRKRRASQPPTRRISPTSSSRRATAGCGSRRGGKRVNARENR